MLCFPAPVFPVFLYAETHFRFFSGFPNLLFKREPEIIFDLPRRCDPGKDLPVVLVVNDVHMFPLQVISVSVTVSRQAARPILFKFDAPASFLLQHPLGAQANVFCFPLERSKLPLGKVYVNCKAIVTNGRRRYEVLNDNLFSSSKLPFSSVLADQDLPGSKQCSYGDFHVHSQFSQSHVEFGPPVNIIDIVSDTCGLDFVAITDHSYDLCCDISDYLKTDNGLARWKCLSADFSKPGKFKSIMILGEEVSAINSQGKAVHLCAAGIKDFVSGSADGARSNKLPTMKIQEVADRVHKQNGLAIAAHPGSRFGLLQRIFLNRGNWSSSDMAKDIDAVQAVNNGFGTSWKVGKRLWIQQLLKGRRLPLVAGNDSHGDFNRYRFIGIPFVAVSENFERYLSSCRTGIYRKVSSQKDVLDAVRDGETFVTNGPFISLTTCKSDTNDTPVSRLIPKDCKCLSLRVTGNYEFGKPHAISIYAGTVGEESERTIFSGSYKNQDEIAETINFESRPERGYVRAEATCLTEHGSTTFAATSPMYFSED